MGKACSSSMTDTHPLESVIETADDVAEEDGSADLKSLIETFGDRAFGPVLTLIGLLAVSPFGAIPGIPIALAVVIVLFAPQILIGRETPWLPDFMSNLTVEESKISSLQNSAGKWLSRIDGLVKRRLDWAAGTIARRFAAAVSIMLACAMVPLEAIPFAVAIPAAGIVLFGIGLTSRDGLVMLFGFSASAIAIFGIWTLI